MKKNNYDDKEEKILFSWWLKTFFPKKYERLRQKKEKLRRKKEEIKYPMTFFHYIAKKHLADEDNLSFEGDKYLEDQIKTYRDGDELLRAIAVEITILSTHISKKYQLINLSFITAGVALALMSLIIFFGIYFGFQQPASPQEVEKNYPQDCGKGPELYGLNENNIWKCSMFSGNSLAGQCARDSSQFNMSLSECHKFIPDS